MKWKWDPEALSERKRVVASFVQGSAMMVAILDFSPQNPNAHLPGQLRCDTFPGLCALVLAEDDTGVAWVIYAWLDSRPVGLHVVSAKKGRGWQARVARRPNPPEAAWQLAYDRRLSGGW